MSASVLVSWMFSNVYPFNKCVYWQHNVHQKVSLSKPTFIQWTFVMLKKDLLRCPFHVVICLQTLDLTILSLMHIAVVALNQSPDPSF